jgi:CIC family chloride channel protein
MSSISDDIPSGNNDQSQPTGIVRRFLRRDKRSVKVLLLASFVGMAAGAISTFFEIGVHWVGEHRTAYLLENSPAWTLAVSSFVISAALAAFGYFITHVFAPDAAGSGIPEIEGAMDDLRPVRWWRVLPVKFFAGLGTLGAGMVLGREGPSVQMGGNVGAMVSDIFRLKDKEGRHALLASGAAAGLSAAFNAPLAGTLFVVEEMRPQFRYSLISIKAVFIASIVANIVYRSIKGQEAVIELPSYGSPELHSLWLYLLLGMLFGVLGVHFNRLILRSLDWYARIHRGELWRYVGMGGLLGGCFGVLLMYLPELTGGGVEWIPDATTGEFGLLMLLLVFLGRLAATLVCFGSGAPGGIFAPMLALGTLAGTLFGLLAQALFPDMLLEPGTFAIAGMGALFAATVRAPLTGTVLVLEMTDNYQLILPMLITCLGATMLAQLLGGRPIYSLLLERTLRQSVRKRKAEEAAAEKAAAEAEKEREQAGNLS